MPVRTPAEMANQIATLLASNSDITAVELRSVVTDLMDSLAFRTALLTISTAAPGNTPGAPSAGSTGLVSDAGHDHGITPGTGGMGTGLTLAQVIAAIMEGESINLDTSTPNQLTISVPDEGVTPDKLHSTNTRVNGYIYGNVNGNTGEWLAPPPRTYDDLNGTVPLVDIPSSIPRMNNAFHFGSGAPAASLGIDGDGYLDTGGGIFYRKASGAWASQYTDQLGMAGTGVTQAQVTGLIDAALAAAVTGNTETGITVTYQAADKTYDFVVATVTPTHPTLVGGTSADATPTSAELTIEGSMSMITFPAFTSMYQLIARLESEGDITSIVFSDDASQTNQIGAFTKFGSTVTYDGNAYSVWVSNQVLTQAAEATATVS